MVFMGNEVGLSYRSQSIMYKNKKVDRYSTAEPQGDQVNSLKISKILPNALPSLPPGGGEGGGSSWELSTSGEI